MHMQDLRPFQLLGSYYGEVCTQEEYDSNMIYDWRRGDNLRDDKTKTLWEDAGAPTCCRANQSCPVACFPGVAEARLTVPCCARTCPELVTLGSSCM